MAQRVLIATCLVVMLACGASVALAWNWMNQDRLLRSRAAAEAIEANRRVSEALAQSQATNQEMLKQMREMTDAVLHPVSPDWNPVTFKLTEEAANGPPAAGFSLTLTRLEGNAGGTAMGQDGPFPRTGSASFSRTDLHGSSAWLLPPGLVAQATAGQFGGMGGMGVPLGKTIRRTSDAAGIADFGAVQPGDYRFLIMKSWPAGRMQHRLVSSTWHQQAGSRSRSSVPRLRRNEATARVRWNWPADLEREHLVLYAPFSFRYRKLAPDLEWSMGDTPRPLRPTRRRPGEPGSGDGQLARLSRHQGNPL